MPRRRVGPICAFLGVWILVSLYFFGDIGPQEEDDVYSDRTFHRPPPLVPDNGKQKTMKVVVEHPQGDTEERNDVVEEEERHVAPVAVVPIEEKEPEVDLDRLARVENAEEEETKKGIYEKYQFNGWLSDKIGPRRKIPDSRNAQCPHVFNETLPKTSIIVCYFNESPSVLIRMVNSILDRTPIELIQEILLIDDSSEWPEASLAATDYKEKHPQWGMVKLVRTEKNEGLIRAKIFGAKKARGEILVFLDSHCEVNQDWLQPLLERIREKRERVVCPIIDIIDSETMKYVESPVCFGGLTWGLVFKWDYPNKGYFENKLNFIRPIRSPSMAGGLFAVDRKYFFEIGTYDQGMEVWGAENVEISFRIWLCGGELEIIPCSRVGHIFRRKRPYGLQNDSMGKNSLRAAKVWLDDYLPFFYKARPYLKSMDPGDLSERLALKEQLHCKKFEWYLHNIYPELLPGNTPQKYELVERAPEPKRKYQIRLNNSTFCLSAESSMGRISMGNRVEMRGCHSDRTQQWRWAENNELRPMGSSRLCMDSMKGLALLKCHNQGYGQEWRITKEGKLYNASSGKCVGAVGELNSLAKLEFCGRAPTFVLEEVTA